MDAWNTIVSFIFRGERLVLGIVYFWPRNKCLLLQLLAAIFCNFHFLKTSRRLNSRRGLRCFLCEPPKRKNKGNIIACPLLKVPFPKVEYVSSLERVYMCMYKYTQTQFPNFLVCMSLATRFTLRLFENPSETSVGSAKNALGVMGAIGKKLLWLVVSTHLKHISQIRSFLEIGMTIKMFQTTT